MSFFLGLRNLKAVLRLTGETLQNGSKEDPENIIVQSLKIVNYPKLHQQDINIFEVREIKKTKLLFTGLLVFCVYNYFMFLLCFQNLLKDTFSSIDIQHEEIVDVFDEAVKICCENSKLRFGHKLLSKVGKKY